jgi:hypothetical protein
MSLAPLAVIERVTRVAPLGVRFWDAATRRYIVDLTVAAVSLARPGRLLRLSVNPSGVYVLQGVPGLRDFEFGEGDEAFWSQMPPPVPYVLAVSDPQRRFLPFSVEVDVPTQGVFRWACGPQASPPEPGSSDIPLFSAMGRRAPEGLAAIYAELFDPLADQPAAWAVLEIAYEGAVLGRGIADANGRVLVLVAYPPPVDFLPLSPVSTGAAHWQQEWTLGVRVGYAPDVFAGVGSLGSPSVSPLPGRAREGVPELCAALSQLDLAPARVWRDAARTALLTEAALRFGHDLVLRSSDAGKLLPRLFVAPAV